MSTMKLLPDNLEELPRKELLNQLDWLNTWIKHMRQTLNMPHLVFPYEEMYTEAVQKVKLVLSKGIQVTNGRIDITEHAREVYGDIVDKAWFVRYESNEAVDAYTHLMYVTASKSKTDICHDGEEVYVQFTNGRIVKYGAGGAELIWSKDEEI